MHQLPSLYDFSCFSTLTMQRTSFHHHVVINFAFLWGKQIICMLNSLLLFSQPKTITICHYSETVFNVWFIATKRFNMHKKWRRGSSFNFNLGMCLRNRRRNTHYPGRVRLCRLRWPCCRRDSQRITGELCRVVAVLSWEQVVQRSSWVFKSHPLAYYVSFHRVGVKALGDKSSACMKGRRALWEFDIYHLCACVLQSKHLSEQTPFILKRFLLSTENYEAYNIWNCHGFFIRPPASLKLQCAFSFSSHREIVPSAG